MTTIICHRYFAVEMQGEPRELLLLDLDMDQKSFSFNC